MFRIIQLLLGSAAHVQSQQLCAQCLCVCVCVVQMLVFKLASLLPAVQGHLDSPAGVRLNVCPGNTFAIAPFAAHGALRAMVGAVVSHVAMHQADASSDKV